ncbi:MAG: ABC transporter substrate-binding protein, partial [Defluviitaleaceae bacterium]|nr:ABC transporter substrate-binding protein [Defluviitaleaceae bacterium]
MFKRRLALVITLLAFVLVITACAGNNDGDGAAADGGGVTPPAQDGGAAATTPGTTNDAPAVPAVEGGELVYAMLSQPPHLDPIRQNDSATSDATHQLFEGLARFEPYPSVTVSPLLATAWRQNDSVTWEFDLRTGVYFHDGSYFNADAMRISLERLLDMREAAPGRFILEMVEEVITVDEYTLQIRTEFPFAPLINHLTHQVGFAISRQAMAEEVHFRLAEGYGEDGPLPRAELNSWQEELLAYADGRGLTFSNPQLVTFNPQGTGPFRFDRQVSGDYTRFVRNEDYWGVRPALDSMRLSVIPDAVTRFLMLQTGEAHVIQASPIDVSAINMDPNLELIRFEGVGIDYIGMTSKEGPLADVRVRRAITKAINTESIILGAYEGLGVPAVGPVGPNVAHSASGVLQALPFDPEAARALLEEAGYGDGLTLNFWSNEGNSARATTGEIVQSYLAAIGITLNLELVEWSVYLDRTGAGEADLFMLGWTTVTGDADY